MLQPFKNRKSKIIATLGPSSCDYENIKKCVLAGMNVVRLNFSHGSYEEYDQIIDTIKKIEEELKLAIPIMSDLQGPKIRVQNLPPEGLPVKTGDQVVITSQKNYQNESFPTLLVDCDNISEHLKKGTYILVDDGLFELVVTEENSQYTGCQITKGEGTILNRKGVNIPGLKLPMGCLTPKDYNDLDFILTKDISYISLSFVQRAQDILDLKAYIAKNSKKTVKVISKIELRVALKNLDKIVEVSDGIMVARGDLGVDLGYSQLPWWQKRIIEVCNITGKPVITATQMLDSMVNNPYPTRAEITDVANAVLDGSDALMLSAETATGKHPDKCIEMMNEIILASEDTGTNYYSDIDRVFEDLSTPQAISMSACLTALKVNAKTIVCVSTTGITATMIAAYRPKTKIIVVTEKNTVNNLRYLSLYWGLNTLTIPTYEHSKDLLESIKEVLGKEKLVEKNDKIIVTLGFPVQDRCHTNAIQVLTI